MVTSWGASLGRGRDVPTRLGDLFVRELGSGPPAVLWHSLFVDSSTWVRVVGALGAVRRLILIDGPGHGYSPGPDRDFDLDDCVGAAEDVLDRCAPATAVDWLGNAWGGHVGMQFGARCPDRCRSLTAVCAPVHALLPAERREIVSGLLAYRILGPVRPLRGVVARALLGPGADVEDSRLVADAFRRAHRRGMATAMRSVSLDRPDATPLLPEITAPTLLVVAAADPTWQPADARAAAARIPSASTLVLPGAGHVAPVLQSADRLAHTVVRFWQNPAGLLGSLGEAGGSRTS